jgi:hypothetical protein
MTMICKTCQKPVYFDTEEYIKFSSFTDGKIFHHLDCWRHGKHTTPPKPLMYPMTAMGEAV